jgi:hypothetical protein
VLEDLAVFVGQNGKNGFALRHRVNPFYAQICGATAYHSPIR